MQAILSTTSQITLPEPVRQQLHLQPGDAVEIIVGEQGEIKLLPNHQVESDAFRSSKILNFK